MITELWLPITTCPWGSSFSVLCHPNVDPAPLHSPRQLVPRLVLIYAVYCPSLKAIWSGRWVERDKAVTTGQYRTVQEASSNWETKALPGESSHGGFLPWSLFCKLDAGVPLSYSISSFLGPSSHLPNPNSAAQRKSKNPVDLNVPGRYPFALLN